MKRLTIVLAACSALFATFPSVSQELTPEKREALEAAGAHVDLVEELSRILWDLSETALREERSAALLVETLNEAGFTVEDGVAGMPTAFVASYGNGSPVIGVLAEYDALPGVGNAAVPRREPRQDGVTSGQGCGHNLFAAASVAGAIAIRDVMEQRGLAGTLRLYGTPAEETVVGKVYMAKAGLFDDLDAVVEWHPDTRTRVGNQQGLAMNNFEVEFFGQAAHGAYDPWNGRSALDAVELMNYGVNLMREHIMPTTRIHYVIPNGGEAPNVVPEYAKVWYYVRDVNRENVEKYYDRVLNIAEGAALGTATERKVTLITGVHEYNLNRPLQEAVQRNLEIVGPPEFTGEDQTFGRELQSFLDVKEDGFSTEVEPLGNEVEPVQGGSTDVAEVSHIVPTVGFSVATAARNVPWHSWATTACHGTDAGVRGAVVASKVIALTGVELLTDAGLRERAQQFFEEATEGAAYVSPIPVDQKPTLPK